MKKSSCKNVIYNIDINLFLHTGTSHFACLFIGKADRLIAQPLGLLSLRQGKDIQG